MAYDQKPKSTISHDMSALYCAVQLKEAHRLLLSSLAIENKDSFESEVAVYVQCSWTYTVLHMKMLLITFKSRQKCVYSL